ncbi:MAG: Hsp33 family molecular chaperone HslO [Proteobacteria bacterium]|nr:Hsp33 family molecular chaperone HslO [Pseudomonadota bacterium]
MTDELVRAITSDGLYRLASASTTDLVTEAIRRHKPSPMGALALARSLTAGVLLSVAEKEFHRIGVQWVGRGPVGTIHVDVRPAGRVRGYLSHPMTMSPTLRDYVGPGAIQVIEQQESGRFTQGSLPMDTHEIDSDLGAWLRRSEQVPSRLRVFTELDEIGTPVSTAGILVQTLPGGAADVLLSDEGPIAQAVLDRSLDARLGPMDLARAALPDEQLTELGREALGFVCECSVDRVERGVSLLGPEDLQEMIEAQEEAKVRCDFCAERYVVGIDRLAVIRQTLLTSN